MSDEFFPTFERHLLDVLEERNPDIEASLIDRAKLAEAVQIVRQGGQTDREGMRRLLSRIFPAGTDPKLLKAISGCFNVAFFTASVDFDARNRQEALAKNPLDERYLKFEQFFLEALSRVRPDFRKRKNDGQTLNTFFRREKLKEISDYWIDTRPDLGQDDLGRLLEELGAVHTDGYILGSFHTLEDNKRFTTQVASAFRQAMQRMRVELHQQRLQGTATENQDAEFPRKHALEVATKHNYHASDLVPICVVVSCRKGGLSQPIKIAEKLKYAAPDFYKGRSDYGNPVEWYKRSPGGFSSHLSRLVKKANDPKYRSNDGKLMSDSIRADYHRRSYPR